MTVMGESGRARGLLVRSYGFYTTGSACLPPGTLRAAQDLSPEVLAINPMKRDFKKLTGRME